MVEIFAVDTDVLSYLFKMDSRAELYRQHTNDKLLILSFMTIAETDRWALEKNWGEKRKQKLADFLNDFTVIHSDKALCLKWAETMQNARRNGRPMQTADAWIAATALLHDIPLITHNYIDYAGVDGLKIITEANP